MRSVKFNNFRDDVARVIASWALDHIATKEYGQRIADLIEVGLEQEHKKAEAPVFTPQDLDFLEDGDGK